jgi:hypothetical protein
MYTALEKIEKKEKKKKEIQTNRGVKGGEKEVGHLSQPRCKTGPAGINEGTRNIHIQKRDR